MSSAVAAVEDDTEHRYRHELGALQIQLVKFQRQLIEHGERVLIIVEGRDAAGKDGAIKHIVEHLSPRETRVVALPAPSSREQTSWYFQRYVRHLPAAAEFVLFNRSWYNRAGVERVMEFCTEAETRAFLEDAPVFERMLTNAGIRLFKYCLDIDREEQAARLKQRRHDSLSQWELSPIDKVAVGRWTAYTNARDGYAAPHSFPQSPWTIVRAADEHAARLNLIRHFLSRLDYRGKDRKLLTVDPAIVFTFDEARLHDGSMAQ